MKYVNAVIENKGRYLDQLFTYGYQDETSLEIGSIITVPFGKNNTLKRGYVVEMDVSPTVDPELIKEIHSVDLNISLTEEIISTAMWMKSRYGITLESAVRCFVPQGKPAKEGKEKEPYKDVEPEISNVKELTLEQENALNTIADSMDKGIQETFLLHGVTSSGKTEVYMQAIEKALNMGKTAIMLVPEISLTKQIIERFTDRFGKDQIAVLHSKLTQRERFDEWIRIRSGQAKVVIGARIGIFAPLENIGVIILDEEHESTYKSDMTPKYETVDIAFKRLMYHKGILILGSATPSVVSYERAKEGIYKLIELKERYNKTPLPLIEIVDMKNELREGNTTIFSDRLYRKARFTLEKGQQIILFLNRRGYSNYLSCRECGAVLKCPECGISLTYHKKENKGICHYCGKQFDIPKVCPECGSKYIKYSGAGTEKVEEFTKSVFPEYNVERLDLNTATNRREINRIIKNFSTGKTNILIGTQLVASGLDFKNVGLVGVINADVSLNVPDYRAAERTFQLITQVSGRAGRGEERGTVIVQTTTPDAFPLVTAANNDYEGFFNQEVEIRKMMDYPPFSDLINIEITGKNEAEVKQVAYDCRKYLLRSIKENLEIFLPRKSFYFKGKDSTRYYVLLKAPKGLRNKYIFYIDNFAEKIFEKRSGCHISIDVNPYGTL